MSDEVDAAGAAAAVLGTAVTAVVDVAVDVGAHALPFLGRAMNLARSINQRAGVALHQPACCCRA